MKRTQAIELPQEEIAKQFEIVKGLFAGTKFDCHLVCLLMSV